MKGFNKEVIALLNKYGSDTKTALKENRRLEYLYALSDIRENLLEWYDFKEGFLLQIGADWGALTGLFRRRVGQVTVLDESEDNLSVVTRRYRDDSGVRCVCGKLTEPETLRPVTEEPGFQGFHYITMIGTLEKPYDTQIQAAKNLLRPGGVLFVAVCNQMGMKYLAGTKRDDHCITKPELEKLLPGGCFYYPHPDYRLPFTIYSDGYLPKKGDLTGTPAVYDYPTYLFMDVGATFDTVCDDGRFEYFANSFLVIWEKGDQK